MDGIRTAFNVVSDRKMPNITAFEWSPSMDLLAVLLGNNSLNVYRALADDKNTKLFSKKIVGGSTLCWSPCGKFVCVAGTDSEDRSRTELSIFDVEGGHVQQESNLAVTALDWVAVSTSDDFSFGPELMIPLLSVPPLTSVLEESQREQLKESREWALLVLADRSSLSINAQATFPVATINVPSDVSLHSARLSLNLRSLSVLGDNELVLYCTRHLSIRRQELRETATLIERAEFVLRYLGGAVNDLRRYWESAAHNWIVHVRDLETTTNVHQEILLAGSGENRATKCTEFLKTANEWGVVKTEKKIMQTIEYTNMIVTTRVFVGAQHLLLLFKNLKARVACEAYKNIGLTNELAGCLHNLAENFLSIIDEFLENLRSEQLFAKTLLNSVIRLSAQLSGSQVDVKEPTKKEADFYIAYMSDKHSLQFETITNALSPENEKSLVQAISKLAHALKCQGEKCVEANSSRMRVLSTLQLPQNRRDTSQTWFQNELILTWMEHDSVVIFRVLVSPAGTLDMRKCVFFSPDWNILLARMYAVDEMVMVLNCQNIPFLCKYNLSELTFQHVSDSAEDIARSQINKTDLEIRQLPDGYLYATDLRASASRGVLSVFARKVRRLLTLDMDEDADEDSQKT